MYLLAPLLDDLIRRIPRRVLIPVCLVLTLCFVGDQVYSAKVPNAGKGITEGNAAAVPTVFLPERPGSLRKEAALWRQSI